MTISLKHQAELALNEGVFVDTLQEISDYIVTTKYSRYLEDQKRRETWDEAVTRVQTMHLDKFDHLSSRDILDVVKAFDLVRQKKIAPSMRSLQFGGAAIEAKNERIYNCLKSDTEFITSTGVKTFEDFSDGDTTTVLSHTGKWREAVVRSYGVQKLHDITISRGKASHVVTATADHRWLLKDGTETTSLKVGDKLVAPPVAGNFDYYDATPDERLYWAYGYVYGDGTRVKDKLAKHRWSMVRLCGLDKIRYLQRFRELGFKTSTSDSLVADTMVYTGSYLKTTPDPEVDDPRLIRAFVRGYLDADGEKNRNINYEQVVANGVDDDKNLYITIQSSERDHVEFIRECFPVAGVYIVSETDLTGEKTNLGVRPYTVKFRISTNPSVGSTAADFVVSEISDVVAEETVWCLEVDVDQSFVLPNGIVTGNCAVRHIDSIRSFAEVFFLLLCGAGTGLGLFDKYLDRLPDLVSEKNKTGTVVTYVVEDTAEGWADSVEALLNCYFVNTAYTGRKIVFDFSKIRPEGAILKTSGGRAPGYKGLKESLMKIKALLDDIIENKGQKRLLSINAYDIIMHVADAVLSGGIRRSATSIMFSKDDELMMNAKTGDWYITNPQRKRSNNSVLLIRDQVTPEEFAEIVAVTQEWGEPGFVFADTEDVLYNPCFEVSFMPVTEDGVCGVQMCNLSTINGGMVDTAEDFIEFAKAAALIGTLQAAYTDFPYLSNAAEKLTRDEALLGVSITAMMESPDVILDPENQRKASAAAVETNEIWAAKLGINPAARVCVIKPEGTSTLALRSMASGIHAAHAKYMFRRVTANRTEPVYQHFAKYNPHAVEPYVHSSSGTDDSITFPIVVPDGAMVKSDLNAIEHLAIIKSTQENWVVPGTTVHNRKPVHHNVSCTVVVDTHEWDEVTRYLYENRNSFAAVSLLAQSGDKDYAQAPMEAVSTDEDVAKFIDLMKNWTPVPYTELHEESDYTAPTAEAACVGGACETQI